MMTIKEEVGDPRRQNLQQQIVITVELVVVGLELLVLRVHQDEQSQLETSVVVVDEDQARVVAWTDEGHP